MKTRCIIVDDEPLARTAIATLLSRFDDMEVVAECGDSFEAFQVLQHKAVDLMFLDIQMPELSGLDFLRTLKNPPAAILTTAFREYALEGFELDVVDYLLKPISHDRMMKAINKYYQVRQVAGPVQGMAEAPPEGFITIRSERKNFRVKLDDILWIRSLKDYVQIFTAGEKYITQVPIGELEVQLPQDQFLRIHRSYIVNMQKVTAYTNLDVEIGQEELPIGRSYRNLVVSALNKFPGHP